MGKNIPNINSKKDFLREINRLKKEIDDALKAKQQVEKIDTKMEFLKNTFTGIQEALKPSPSPIMPVENTQPLAPGENRYNPQGSWDKTEEEDNPLEDTASFIASQMFNKFYKSPNDRIIEQNQKQISRLVRQYPQYAKDLGIFDPLKPSNKTSTPSTDNSKPTVTSSTPELTGGYSSRFPYIPDGLVEPGAKLYGGVTMASYRQAIENQQQQSNQVDDPGLGPTNDQRISDTLYSWPTPMYSSQTPSRTTLYGGVEENVSVSNSTPNQGSSNSAKNDKYSEEYPEDEYGNNYQNTSSSSSTINVNLGIDTSIGVGSWKEAAEAAAVTIIAIILIFCGW